MTAAEPKHPSDDDPEHWRRVIAEGRLDASEPGCVLRAFWKARDRNDARVEAELIGHLSDVVVRMLTRKAKGALPDGGREIVDEVLFAIVTAMLEPGSADGLALSRHFDARVHFRFIDALRRQRRRHQVELPPLVSDEGVPEEDDDPSALAGYGSVDVGQALSRIRDERKRIAFVMTMGNHPKGEIAAMIGIDRKTLYLWLGEVRAFLKSELDL